MSGALWLIGMVWLGLASYTHRAGWFQLRLDGPGLVLLTSALIGGWNFFPKALRGLGRYRLDMNFLMTIAIAGALLIGEPIEAAAIAALFSFVELLEAAAVVRARRAVEALVVLSPEEAALVAADGSEELVPTNSLQRGHVVRVRPGDRIPIDGVVRSGESEVDEASVTGESVPVAKARDSEVFAGTMVVQGFLEIEATTDAGNTTLDRIVKLVRQAEARKVPIEHVVERFARWYTPAVTGTALLVMIVPPLLGWGTNLEWFTRGLSLLVIACPCALVIATPVTVVSALTSAARNGVIIKGGEFLESLGATRAIAFDKTGTLTEGRLEVTDVIGFDGVSAEELLALAGPVEARSEHPIAEAVVRRWGGKVADGVTDFEALPGRGVTAMVNGHKVRVGTMALFPESAVPDGMQGLEEKGRTVILVGDESRILGLVAVADTVRANAAKTVRRLERMGMRHVVILTGDNAAAAGAVGEALGISDVRARLLPEQKVAAIENLVREYHGIAMVGDGVNDAPALATATVGIAMGGAGSPAAVETADVALMADDLTMLPYAIRVARLSRSLVRFNIAAALSLKLLLAIGAVAGVVDLLIAVLVGDMGASIVVTLNAMRLARLRASQ